MPQIKGIVSRIASKPKTTKFGKAYAVGIVVDEEWYNFLSKKQPEDLGLEDGSTVAFTYSDNDFGHNVDLKSLAVAEPKERKAVTPGKRSGGKSYASSGQAGVACGHAINNAVQLAIADGDTSLRAIYEHATDILKVSVALQGKYDEIVNSVGKAKVEPAPAPKPEPEPEEESEDASLADGDDGEWEDEIPF